jgi:hypothetical protein
MFYQAGPPKQCTLQQCRPPGLNGLSPSGQRLSTRRACQPQSAWSPPDRRVAAGPCRHRAAIVRLVAAAHVRRAAGLILTLSWLQGISQDLFPLCRIPHLALLRRRSMLP